MEAVTIFFIDVTDLIQGALIFGGFAAWVLWCAYSWKRERKR